MSDLAQDVVDLLKSQNKILVTAESCTGGGIASAITDIPGSSEVFDRGFVTYSNQAKIDHLGVSAQTLQDFGAVSEQTATEMAQGALSAVPQSNVAISVTGIAGPNGGSDEKPVGLVYIGLTVRGSEPKVHKYIFDGSRSDVRAQAVNQALLHLKSLLQTENS